MTLPKRISPAQTLALATVILTAAVFFLFREVLQPNYCLFSNDAPLGLVQSQAGRDATSDLSTGYWSDLNWVGSQSPSITPCPSWLIYQFWRSTVLNSKLHAPVALAILGLSVSLVGIGLRFRPMVCIVAGLGAALASNPVSYACWGLPGKALTIASCLASIYLINLNLTGARSIARFMLAGFAVGLAVMEGGDVGAIMSLYVGTYCVWRVFCAEANPGKPRAAAATRFLVGVASGGLVAICAGWIAWQSLFTLVGTQLHSGDSPRESKESETQKWDFATSWSMPIVETSRLLVPGLFGYRMDTPGGGAYWGGVGPDGNPARRFSGSGEYVGLLVLLVGALGTAHSLRREKGPFSPEERRQIWFWAAASVLSLLFSYGRFAPFYYIVYKLPYFSNIRIPMKFLHGMNMSLWILFAYGLEGIGRLYLDGVVRRASTLGEAIDEWRRSAPRFETRLLAVIWGLAILAGVSAIIYTVNQPNLQRHLAGLEFAETQAATAAFSMGEAWKAVVVLVFFSGMLSWAIIGAVAPGTPATIFWWVLALGLTVDLVRSDRPFVKSYDYKVRYETNPLFDLLMEKPWEHRVTAYLVPQRAAPVVSTQEFAFLHKEWLENCFQFYNIQSLDIDQMPRMPEAEQAYLRTFQPPELGYGVNLVAHLPELSQLPPQQQGELKAILPKAQAGLFAVTRLWELTNTRYILGWAAGIDTFNELFDPKNKRFKIKMQYALTLKPGANPPSTNTPIADAVQTYAAIPDNRGPLALIEFTGALPRAGFYQQCEVMTNQQSLLERLVSPAFDPAKTVILGEAAAVPSRSSHDASGEVQVVRYAPKNILLKSKSSGPGIVLLNDRWNPFWKAEIDGRPVPILVANFLMRAVQVDGGEHTIEFRFSPPKQTFWLTILAFCAAPPLMAFLVWTRGKPNGRGAVDG